MNKDTHCNSLQAFFKEESLLNVTSSAALQTTHTVLIEIIQIMLCVVILTSSADQIFSSGD